jgi:hypothetical protein
MKVIEGLASGPFKDEAAFKAAVIKAWRKKAPWFARFQIENEEKEPGMPDVLSMSGKLPAFFTEFKISNAKGAIEFTKAQPLFYRQHEDLHIDILAWDVPRKRVVQVSPQDVFARHSVSSKGILFELPEEIYDVEAAG